MSTSKRQPATPPCSAEHTVEFEPAAAGTRMRWTEQAAFLDAYVDAGARAHGTRALFDNLAAARSAG